MEEDEEDGDDVDHSDDEEEKDIPQPAKKLSKKQLKKLKEKEAREKALQQRDNEEDEDNSDDEEEKEDIPQPVKKLSKKQLKKLKEKERAQGFKKEKMEEDDDVDQSDDEEEEDIPPPVKKLSKKQLKKLKEKEAPERSLKKKDDDDEDNSDDEEKDEISQPVKKLSKKELKKLKEKERKQALLNGKMEEEEDNDNVVDKSDEEDEEEEEMPQPVKLSKKELKKLKEKEAHERALKGEDDNSDGEEEKEEIPQPEKKLSKKQLRKKGSLRETVEEDGVDNDELDDDGENAIQSAVEKPFKKERKKLKEKKAKAQKSQNLKTEGLDDDNKESAKATDESMEKHNDKVNDKDKCKDGVDLPQDEIILKNKEDISLNQSNLETKVNSEGTDKGDDKKKKKKKTKLELKLEAAMQKKREEEERQALLEKEKKDLGDAVNEDQVKEADQAPVEKKKKKDKKEKKEKSKKDKKKGAEEEEKVETEVNTTENLESPEQVDGENGAEEEFYGAPDDNAWTDKSEALRLAEEEAAKGPDLSLMYDKDGKKLSNKERKRLAKAREAEARMAEYEIAASKASAEGKQFACSQTSVNVNDPQWLNSLDIKIPSFNISAAGKVLFQNSALVIAQGRRYGLVGPNGKGKSTLLKMIASRDLILPPRVDFLYVEQEVVADDTPAVEAVLKADTVRWNLLSEEKELSKKIDEGCEESEVLTRMEQVYDELQKIGAASAESKARRILYGLGFDIEMQTKPTKMFSGGWRMRISLARALFMEPTLLMLDEPTNHLDLNAVIWLDDYLQKWKKTLLIVSHDQDFLNSVCQEILHIEDLKLFAYKGNYDSFKKAERTKRIQQQKDWEKQEKRLRELKRSGQSKQKATETVNKSKSKREAGARAVKKKANDAVASGTSTAETTELIKRPKEYVVRLEFSEVPELSRPVMEVTNVKFRYTEKHPLIFEKIDFGIDMDSRICVVGPNGAGKSTLLKLLTGEVAPTKGSVRRNPRLRMGIYNQHFVDRLPMNKTPIEHLRDRFQDQDYQSVRNRLGKYGLEGHAHEVVMRDLSGGQKARVVFVELSLQRPHVLLLDEPTNNLDIETIDALCDAVNNFNGGIVVVTHDQRLIEECNCTLWVVDKQKVTPWEQGFDHYKDTLLTEMEEAVQKEAAIRQVKLEAAAAARAEKIARLSSKQKK